MTSLTVLNKKEMKRMVLVDLRYPYGKSKVYMNGSVTSVAAQLMAAGHNADIVDLNFDGLEDARARELFSRAHVIGVSVTGSPHIPGAIRFCQYAAERYRNAKVVVGGQVIRGLDPQEFRRVFGKRAVQARSQEDCAAVFGPLPGALDVPFQPVWENMGDSRLRRYIDNKEFSLVLSQGCIYDCGFCGADKDTPERHRTISLFESDMRFLLEKSRQFGITAIECYASPLDFFQNPATVALYLKVLGDVFADSGVRFRMRALSCMNTFLKAARTLPDFAGLVGRAGLWCIGFGVDGADEEVWKRQHKLQNHTQDIVDCLDLCQALGIRSEVLMVMGYPSDTAKQMCKVALNSFRYAYRWPKVVLRPYLAKVFIPGNLGWEIRTASVEKLMYEPNKFYNLDFCSLGSPLTHPRRIQRWLANLSYLAVIAGLLPFGRCCTSPLLPQGQGGAYGAIAKLVNRYMPFDR